MDLIGEFTRRLDWEMAPFFYWAFHHWAISLLTLLLSDPLGRSRATDTQTRLVLFHRQSKHSKKKENL